MNISEAHSNDFSVRFPSFCPICDGVYWDEHPLCSSCRDLLIQEILSTTPAVRWVENIKVRSLFHWQEGVNRQLIPEILYTLKQGKCPRLAEYLCDLFLLRNGLLKEQKERVFIPAAARKRGEKDHARVLAEIFSQEVVGAFVFSPLVRKDERQKQKNLQARRTTGVGFITSRVRRFHRLRQQRAFVFCDDVVTSGSTLLASYKAMGAPPHFECWCLAFREKSIVHENMK